AGDGGQQPYILFGDGFITEVDPTGTKFLYSSLYGGNQDDIIMGLALDNKGNIYVAGNTLSINLKSAGTPAQKTYGGARQVPVFLTGDGFVAVFSGFPVTSGGG